MKIKNLEIKNKHIEINVDNLDFSNKGIYHFKGSNGSGKTTIIEKALKENNISDLNDSLEKSVSYFSQSNFVYKKTISEYIKVYNQGKLDYYLDLFDIKHLKGSIENLSGGEFVKLRIIRTLMKDTPIIIFDEPTNNLDKKSIDIFKEVLEKLRNEKTIIIMSHDERFDIEADFIYQIESNRVVVLKTNDQATINNYQYIDNLKIDKRYFKYICNSTFNIFLLAITIILLVFIGNYNVSYLQSNVQFNDKYPNNNYMEVLDDGSFCSAYYTLSLNSEDYLAYCNDYDRLTIDDLTSLSKHNFVEKIYVRDENFDDFKVLDGASKNLFAIPNVISDNQSDDSSVWCTNNQIIKGRIPHDNKNEVALSEKVLFNSFNFSKDINSAIGAKIKIGNEEHEIVGITKSNTTCLSFNDNNQYGIITFNEDNLSYFKDMIEELEKSDQKENFRILYIVFNEKYAEDLANEIVKLSKSHQISSNYTHETIEQDNYLKSLPYLIVVNVVGFSLALSLVLILVRKTLIMINDYMNDYKNLTYEYKKIDAALIKVLIADFIFALIVSLISVFFIYGLKIGMLYMLVPFYIIYLILLLIIVRIVKLSK